MPPIRRAGRAATAAGLERSRLLFLVFPVFPALLAAVLVAAPLAAQAAAGASARGVTPWTPPPDPVVMPGVTLEPLVGRRPDRIVAFAVRGQKWVQIPVQIDERVALPFARIRQRKLRKNPTGLFYADPHGASGADPDPRFDADDELVLLQEDGGAAALPTFPDGVRKTLRCDVTCPELPKDRAHFYLFESDGTLRPDANRPRMRYSFRLAGDKPYDNTRGPNEERSTIDAPTYRLGFRDRWILDELRITTPKAPGVDILDRHKIQLIPGNCIRTTTTFSMGEGYAVANIDGPVRSIRAVMGANSGPLTERIWIAYPRRLDITNHLRVHRLPSVWMFFDYSADALGMRYADNLNPDACVIDGKPDDLNKGRLRWQFLTGDQGSLCIHYQLDTNIPRLLETSHSDDDRTPDWRQCTGDNHAFGVAGPFIRRLPSTDPTHDTFRRLSSTVTLYPGTPNAARPAAMQPPRPPKLVIQHRPAKPR